MKLIADFHTHSKFSRFGHGKDTIEEMVHQANELGLKELGITDHGYKHFFRTSLEKMKRARKVIDDINTWSKTKILLGIEANLIGVDGEIDIDEDTLDLIDILIVGYHRMIKTDFAGYFGGQKNNQTAIDKVTNAYIHAIESYPITIISHLDSVLTTDLYRIGCACRDKGVMVEINARHLNWSKEQIEALLKSECMFVVNSDAHCRDDIAMVDNVIEFIKKYNIPSQLIANMEFTEEEMTQEDLENSIYYAIYQKRLEEQKERNKIVAAKNGGSSRLSKEMEDALQKIASEQGIDGYERLDGTINEDEILNDENFIKETEDAINDLRSMLKTKSEIENLSNNSIMQEGKHENEAITQTNNQLDSDDDLSDLDDENRANVRETVVYNEVKEKNNNFVSSDNIFFSSSDNLSTGVKHSTIQEKDVSYETRNNQEEQVEYLKNNVKPANIANDISVGELKESYDDFFDDGVDASSFNVNDRRSGLYGSVSQNQNKVSSQSNIGVHKNYNASLNSNNTHHDNSENQANSVKKKPRAGNFYSVTGDVLGVQEKVEINPKQSETVEKKETKNVRPTQLGNGLIDFSSLKDEDD